MNKTYRQYFVTQLTLVAILGGGALAVWLFVAGLGLSIFIQRIQEAISENLVVARSGQVLVSQYHRDGNFSTYRTLEGLPVNDSKDLQINYGAYFSAPEENGRPHFYSLEWYRRLIGFCSTDSPPTLWYLYHDGSPTGHWYFIGFNSASKEPIGFLGLAGFRIDEPPLSEQFAIDSRSIGLESFYASDYSQAGRQPFYYNAPYSWFVYVVSGGKLWLVNLDQRSVRAVEGLSKVISVSTTSEPPKDQSSDYARRVAVRTANQVFILNSDAKLLFEFPIPEELQHKPIVFFNWWTSSPIVAHTPWNTEDHATYLSWLDAAGKVTKQERVELLWTPPESVAHKAWVAAVLLPSTVPAAYVFGLNLPRELVLTGAAPDYATALNRVLAAGWPAFLTVCLLSAALAVWCYRRHRRYSQRGAGMWAAVVLLFGSPVLIGYLLHRRWPVMEQCAKCAAETPRDRDTCLSCGAEFPPPPLKGIEVFA